LTTACHDQLTFESLFSKGIIADFEGGRINSDAGGLLLRELDQRYRLADWLLDLYLKTHPGPRQVIVEKFSMKRSRFGMAGTGIMRRKVGANLSVVSDRLVSQTPGSS
jgi:hypothetical protein